jgi:hypothetical protein
MTPEQKELHEDAGEEFHVPAIVHRSGGVSADELNICGICGCQITLCAGGYWAEVDDETADKLRSMRS